MFYEKTLQSNLFLRLKLELQPKQSWKAPISLIEARGEFTTGTNQEFACIVSPSISGPSGGARVAKALH